MKTKHILLATLLAAATASASASVRVYGEATSTGAAIQVQVFADITSPAIVSYSYKLFYPATHLELLAASPNDAVWYFHDGSHPVNYPAPDSSVPGEVLCLGGRLDARNPLAGVVGNRVLLGTARFSRRTSQTPSFDMSIGRAGQFASFVTVHGAVLEAQPGQVSFQSVSSDPNDGDLDGLNDKWEERFFGSIRGAFYSDDPDRDGVSNQGEEAMGSDPTDPRSNLRLVIAGEKERMILEWPSADDRLYSIEVAKELHRFEVLKEGIPATPPLNTFELDRTELSEALFFRVRVETRRAR